MLTTVNSLCTKQFRELQYADTDEEMVSQNRQQSAVGLDHKVRGQVPLFQTDTDGSKPKSPYIMGRRNWCRITLEQPTANLLFDIRVEKEKGHGETVGYEYASYLSLHLTFHSLAGILYRYLRHDGHPRPLNEPSFG